MKKNTIIPGLLLIGIGLLLFFGKLGVFRFHGRDLWFLVLMLLGILLFVNAFVKPDRRGVFPATFLFLLGLFWALQRYEVINPYMDEMWPMFFLILGISFWVSFIFHRRHSSSLIWGLIFLVIGSLFFAAEMGYISHWEAAEWVSTYWPAGLILFGIAILLRNVKRRTVHE